MKLLPLALLDLAVVLFAGLVLLTYSHNGLVVSQSLTYEGNNGDGPFPLEECEGDCDDDEECSGDLKCFDDDDAATVPGCSGTRTKNKKGNYNDYCYDPNIGDGPTPSPIVQPTPAPVDRPTPSPVSTGPVPSLKMVGNNGGRGFPLGLCEG